MPTDDISLGTLAQRVKALEDSLPMHRHTGFDNSSQLINTPISKARFVNDATLGDGIGKSGTLDLRLAPNKGDVYIKANITAGDFANAGAKTGFIFGLDDSDSDKAKFYFGSPTQYIKYDGTTLTVVGNLSASSIDIPDAVTTASFHVDSSGNTWWGATTLGAALASVTAAGVGTFAGLSVINKKAFTNFETATRYVTNFGGSGANTFGNQGVTISPGTTGGASGSFSLLQWRIGNVFTNDPTFTATLIANSLHAASNDGACYVGLGQPTVTGLALTLTPSNIGFYIRKNSGVVTVSSNVADGVTAVSNSITTISDGDVIELFVKVSGGSTKVQFYYRKNGGTLTLGDTITTHIPTGASEDTVSFLTTNFGFTTDFSLIVQGAAYEH